MIEDVSRSLPEYIIKSREIFIQGALFLEKNREYSKENYKNGICTEDPCVTVTIEALWIKISLLGCYVLPKEHITFDILLFDRLDLRMERKYKHQVGRPKKYSSGKIYRAEKIA